MTTITDKWMQSKPGETDRWTTQPFMRGGGVFMGRITPAGERTFYFRYTDSKGRRPFLPLGPYSAKGEGGLTVRQAYERAAEYSKLYRSGVRDLREHLEQEDADRRRAEEDARRAALEAADRARQQLEAAQRRVTVRKLFEQWRAVELAPQTLADGTRTGRKDGGAWVLASFERRVFPTLGNVAAEEVRRGDLLAILDKCKAEGVRRTANVLLADLRQMFRFAVEREIVPRNPLEGIKKANIGGKDAERDRILSDEEIQALRDAVPKAKMHPRSALAIWLLLSTAARVGEAMAARWEHIDLDQATWYLPDTKNQRDHTIHLSAFALRQFRALAALRESIRDENGNERPVSWVFPNSARNGPVCAKSFGKQLADRQRLGGERLKNRTKSEDSLVLQGGKWTAHDLRRTAATIMAKLDVSTDVIDECLNHKLRSKVARVYIRDRREVAQRIAFDALGAHLDALVNRPPVSNVMPFATRAASRAQSLIADAVLVTTANAL